MRSLHKYVIVGLLLTTASVAALQMTRILIAVQLHQSSPSQTTASSLHNRRETHHVRKLGSLSTSICSQYGLQDKPAGAAMPRVIDCFLASNELDMMEIRLRELEQIVDAFVIVESRMTFRGRRKVLHFPGVMNRLPAPLLAKIKYTVLDDLLGNNAWEKEVYQRDNLFSVGLQKAAPQPGDVVMVSDCDEIPKPMFLSALKQCAGVQFPVSMQAAHHYYSFGLAASNIDKVWNQPRAIDFSATLQDTPHKLRLSAPKNIYPNSSWHCSTCFRSIAAVQTKIASFSHSEFDTPSNNDPETIISRVKDGKDLFNRPQMQFVKDSSGDMPAFITAHPSRFSYLISRDLVDAGFRDLGMPTG